MVDWLLGIILTIGLMALADWLHARYRNSKYLVGFNGPPHIPLLGRALDFYDPTLFYQIGYRFALSLGPNIRGRLGMMEFAFITEPKLVETVLTNINFLSKSVEYRLMEKWLGKGLLTSTGDRWRKDRKFLTPAFHFNNLDQFVSCFNANGNILIQLIKDALQEGKHDVSFPFLSLYTLDVICESVMGISVNAQKNANSKYVESVKILTETVYRRTTKIWALVDFLYMFSKDYWLEKRALKVLHGTTNAVIVERRKRLLENPDLYKDSKKCTAFLDMLLQATVDGRPLTNEEIREQVDTFMFEGHDTTAIAIGGLLHLLSKYPEEQEKVYNEIRSIAGDNKNHDFTYEDLNSMSYLSLAIKESLRLYPSVPIIGRTVEEDVKVDGILFPKGLHLMIPIIFLHRNHEVFEDPEIFKPERFLKENWSPQQVFSYVPFSAGFRNCIGQKFAVLEVKAAISKILMNFIVESVAFVPEPLPDVILRVKESNKMVNLKLRN